MQWKWIESSILPRREEDEGRPFLCYVNSNMVVLRYNSKRGGFYRGKKAIVATYWMEVCPPGD